MSRDGETQSDIEAWLSELGLERLLPVFVENEIDGEALRLLTEKDLKELGIALGPRKKILNALLNEPAPAASPQVHHEIVTGERRQVVALFCDIVGYTALSQRIDAEDLEGIVRHYEDVCTICVARYEGYVFQKQGDGIIAIFGYPFAHESEAERAVRTSLEIIQRMRSILLPDGETLKVRIGIASGIVVVGSGRDRLTGDCLNLASRLEAAAEPGSVLVSEDVRRMARGWFEYKDLGGLEYKGFATPVRTFRVLGPSMAQTRFAALSQISAPAMVGRDSENALLLEKWETVRRSETGMAAILNGDPGIGKSRLLNSFASAVRAQGVGAISIQCSAFYANSAYHPLKPQLKKLAGIRDDDSEQRKLQKISLLILDEFGGDEEEVRLLASVLSVPYETRFGAIDISAGAASGKTRSLVSRLLSRNWSVGPTVLLYEDIHWADPSTVSVLMDQFSRVKDSFIMIVATHRPEFDAAWAEEMDISQLTLGKLNPEECIELALSIDGEDRLSKTVISHIAERSEGIPLFVEELTRTVLETLGNSAFGEVPESDEELIALSIPGTLRELIMARLDRSAEAKEVAQIGAVIGREFDHHFIKSLHVISEQSLENGLNRLTELGLAYQSGRGSSARYVFKHALVQDAARDSLLRSVRKTLHGKIAKGFEKQDGDTVKSAPEILAQHFEHASLSLKAAEYYNKAGELAVQRFAIVEGISYFEKALKLIGAEGNSTATQQLELEVRKQLGPLIMAQHGWGKVEVAGILEPALTLAKSLDHRSSFLPILNTLNIHYFSVCDMSASLNCARQLLDIGEATGDEELVIMGHRASSAAYFWRGEFREALKSGDRVRKLYDPVAHHHITTTTNNDPFSGEGVYRSQILWMTGYPDQARIVSDEKDQNSRRRGHPFDTTFSLTLGAQVFEYLRDPQSLLDRADEAERIGKRYGLAVMTNVMVPINRGLALYHQGQFDESADLLDLAINRFHKTGHRVWLSYLRAREAEARAEMGDLERALHMVEQSIRQIEIYRENAHLPELRRIFGKLLMKSDRVQEAEVQLTMAHEAAKLQQSLSWELRAATTLAECLQERQLERAHDRLRTTLAKFTEGFSTPDHLDAKAVLARFDEKKAG